jgi:hypothetical protein
VRRSDSGKVRPREDFGEPEGDDYYLQRLDHLLSTQTTSTEAVFGHCRPTDPDELRPDFVLLHRDVDTDEIERIAVGEVKYTRNQSTAADGLEELLEYMIYTRKETSGSETRYFTTGPDHFTTPTVQGFLCIDRVPHSAVGYPSVGILEFGDGFQRPF